MNLFLRFRLRHVRDDSGSLMSDAFRVSEEAALKTALQQAYAAPEVSDNLRQRVAELAVLHNQQQVMRPRARWPRIALAVMLFSLAVSGMVAWPRVHAALLLRRTQIAMRNAQAAHIVTWQIGPDASSRRKQSEVFYSNGRWHVEKSYGNSIYEMRESLSAEAHSAVVEEVTRPLGFSHMDTLALLTSPHDMLLAGFKSRLQATDMISEQGRSCAIYTWTMDGFPRESQDVTLDARTGLPVKILWRQQDEHDVWRTVALVEYEFNASNGPFYAGAAWSQAKREGIGASRDEWEYRLQTRRMYIQRGKTMIALRDVRVNCDGSLFVLYTAGHKPGDDENWGVNATDDQGNTYLNAIGSPLRPTLLKANRVVGFTFNGEALEGAYLVPLQPLKAAGTAWKPRHLTIALYPHYRDASLAYVDDGKHNYVSNGSSHKYMPLRFTLYVEQADSQRVPSYTPYLAMQPGDWGLQYAAAWTRAIYWRDTKHDPTQALTWFQRVEAINNAEMRARHWQINNVYNLLEQAKLQTRLGRPAEAHQTLLRANARRAYADTASVRELDAALKKEAGINH